jgi:hypothetical protein
MKLSLEEAQTLTAKPATGSRKGSGLLNKSFESP